MNIGALDVTPGVESVAAARGAVIRRRREQLGLSRKRAAELSGVSADSWQTIENGGRHFRGEWKVADPNAATLSQIDHALEWLPGSARAVLDGREPTPIQPSDDPVQEAVLALTQEVKLLRARLQELEARLPQSPEEA